MLILSLVLIFSGIVSLLGTVMVSRKEIITPWKNGAVVLLMHRLDWELRDEFAAISKVGDMDLASREVLLRMG